MARYDRAKRGGVKFPHLKRPLKGAIIRIVQKNGVGTVTIRYDDDGMWEWEPAGILDEDGEDIGDYVLTGSYPMSHWQTMLFAIEGVDVPVDMLQGAR